jgi:hypothetical protein
MIKWIKNKLKCTHDDAWISRKFGELTVNDMEITTLLASLRDRVSRIEKQLEYKSKRRPLAKETDKQVVDWFFRDKHR